MDGFLSVLLVTAVCYFMMRSGCGAHMSHGHGRSHSHPAPDDPSAAMSVVDPVCGMTIRPEGEYTHTHNGRSYHFCSLACLEKFDATPEAYVRKAAA